MFPQTTPPPHSLPPCIKTAIYPREVSAHFGAVPLIKLPFIQHQYSTRYNSCLKELGVYWERKPVHRDHTLFYMLPERKTQRAEGVWDPW